MLVIPKEFDPLLHQPDHPHHLLPFDQHSRRAHFELGAAVALAPCPGGAPLAWHGSLIHWGGACSAYTDADPRISLTAALRVRQSAECRARQNHRRSPSSGLISVSSPTRKRARPCCSGLATAQPSSSHIAARARSFAQHGSASTSSRPHTHDA
mmetsp:Transcript_26798/g.86532  ORF Transcript_26798/g.86532 Transcript_26798/m.86532 type:complete len:154 (+) Transcript_26798:957-1418(+)